MADPVKLTELQLDKRIIERTVAQGLISQSQLEQYLGTLPDLTEQSDNIAPLVYAAHPPGTDD